MRKVLLPMAVMILSGCATMQDFTACTLVGALANQRSYTFNGRVNGERYKDTVDWSAGATDPNFFDPFECTQMLARRRELIANPIQPGEIAEPAVQP